MGNAVKVKGNMQLWGQRAPFRARKDRRKKNIGRLNAEVGLNTAHEFIAIPEAMDFSLHQGAPT